METKIQNLYSEIETYCKVDNLSTLLNKPPLPNWVKEHPFIKGWKYIPIDVIEKLLSIVFKLYKIEIIDARQVLNGALVHVRIHYVNPVTNEWNYHDGIGVAEFQTVKDSGVLKPDFGNLNKGAVTIAFPIAEAYAIKDAAEKFGNLFGANLNRKDVMNFISNTTELSILKK